MSDPETIIHDDEIDNSIGSVSISHFDRVASHRASMRSQITSSTFDASKYDKVSLGSENVFDDSGDAVMGYRDLMKQLREMEKENFSLKTRVYFLEDALAQYVEHEGEITRDELKYELQTPFFRVHWTFVHNLTTRNDFLTTSFIYHFDA